MNPMKDFTLMMILNDLLYQALLFERLINKVETIVLYCFSYTYLGKKRYF